MDDEMYDDEDDEVMDNTNSILGHLAIEYRYDKEKQLFLRHRNLRFSNSLFVNLFGLEFLKKNPCNQEGDKKLLIRLTMFGRNRCLELGDGIRRLPLVGDEKRINKNRSE